MNRRQSAVALAAWTLGGAAFRASAQSAFPSRPIKIVNPFPPGSPVDVVARLVAQQLQQSLGASVVVDNKGGAGGTLGAEQVARAPADGYTLLVTSSSTHVIAPALRKELPYDPVKDFVPIALVAYGPTALVVHPSLPVNTLAEFVRYAKDHPGKVAYASSGPGTILHLSGELFQSRTSTVLLHVPYRGAVPASTDLLGGQVQAMFDSISNAAPQVQSGKLRALAVMTPKRSPLLPDVPTAAEAGFSGLDFPAWIGLFAPAGVPREVVDRCTKALQAGMAEPEAHKRLSQAGLIPAMSLGDEFAKTMAVDRKTVAELVKKAAIPLQ